MDPVSLWVMALDRLRIPVNRMRTGAYGLVYSSGYIHKNKEPWSYLQTTMPDEGAGEQYGHGFVIQTNAILQEEEASDDITDIMTCVGEEENGKTESESSSCEESRTDEDDTGNIQYYMPVIPCTCIYLWVQSFCQTH